MSTKRLFWMMAVSAFVLVSAQSQAQEEAQAPQQQVNIPPKDKEGPIPQLINYQGNLSDSNGQPANGTSTIVFKIYDVATEGTELYTETQTVAVSNGSFNVLLGSVTPIPLNLFEFGRARFLEIAVNNTVMTPRRQFGSVPYAFSSGTTSKSTSGGNIVPGGWDWDDPGGVVRLMDSADNVGIGTVSPAKKLVVGGGAGASGIINDGIFVNIPGGAAVTARNSTGGVETQLNSEADRGTIGTYSNHPLNFRTNNVERIRIDVAGNVGIGATTPLFKLDMQPVGSNARLGKAEIGAWPNNPNFYAYFGHEALNHTLSGNYALLQGQFGDTYLNAATGQPISFRNSNITRMILTSTGNLGIGMTSPAFKLDVGPLSTNARLGRAETGAWPAGPTFAYFGHEAMNHGVAGNYALLQSPTGDTFLNAALTQAIQFRINNSPQMILSSAGNVGIGTISPVAKLHVDAGTGTGIVAANTSAAGTALEVRNGKIKVTGAGLGTTTPVFIHRATAVNTSTYITTIDHPSCNGNPNAILIVTPNWNPGGGAGGTYNDRVIGVYYTGTRWAIFNQDRTTPMPVDAAFNVLVVTP